MIELEKISQKTLPSVIRQFPFDVIKMTGAESLDFLQRITTNDLKYVLPDTIQKTLLVTDKGKILDTVWVISKNTHLLMLVSKDMVQEIILWLNKYIIMEEIVLSDVSAEYEIDFHFDQNNNFFHIDYFGYSFALDIKETPALFRLSEGDIFKSWRIENGIPWTKKELIQDFNPLELNLWDWISFTKGCYIGQEVIARLDTYNKIQRSLIKISSNSSMKEKELLSSAEGIEVGKITSVVKQYEGYGGLAVVRTKFATEHVQLKTKETNAVITIEKVFQKEMHGRN